MKTGVEIGEPWWVCKKEVWEFGKYARDEIDLFRFDISRRDDAGNNER